MITNHQSRVPEHRFTTVNFPCLVGDTEFPEDPEQAADPLDKYHIHARNALRNLTYGAPFFKGSIFKWSNLASIWLSFHSLFLKRDAALLKALRAEMQKVFTKAYTCCHAMDAAAEARLEIFINTFVSNFSFMEPEEGDTLVIPQRIDSQWQLISYRVKKIDISPRRGWLTKWLEQEDHLYAYGLEPPATAIEANPYLLLMGTAYFSCQGASLSWLSDMTPGKSVGESHDLSHLETWLRQYQKVKISGHSQGGTMAMLVAAQYPEHTLQADCLNPIALHHNTLRRLEPWWRTRRTRHRNPDINVYVQKGDPFFSYGDGFLSGTRIFNVSYSEAAQCSWFFAHARHFSGHKDASITQMENVEKTITTRKRQFFNDFKYFLDRIVSPLVKANFIYSLARRKTTRFCQQQSTPLRLALFGLGLALCLRLISRGVLSPTAILSALPFLKNTVGAYLFLSTFSLTASTLFAFTLPKAMQVSTSMAYAALLTVGLSSASVALFLGGLGSALNTCRRLLIREPLTPHPAYPSLNQSTRASLYILKLSDRRSNTRTFTLGRSNSAPFFSSSSSSPAAMTPLDQKSCLDIQKSLGCYDNEGWYLKELSRVSPKFPGR